MALKLTHVPLTPMDHLHKPNYLNLCFYFPLKSDAVPKDVFKDLSRGLRKAFYKIPWLSGKVYNQAPGTSGWRPGQREIRYQSVTEGGPLPHQLLYNELNSEFTYAELKEMGFPSDVFDEEDLLSVPVEGDLDAGCDVFVAQANFISGGFILCMSTCHAAIDGTGMVTTMKLWADHCRSLHDLGFTFDDLPSESSDRSLLDRVWNQESLERIPDDADPWMRGLVGLRQVSSVEAAVAEEAANERNKVNKQSSGRRPTNRAFYISSASQATLRKECDAAVGVNVLSSNDIVTALMWRGLVRARAADFDGTISDTSVLESAIDGRTDFSQAVPPSYLGNITFYNQAELPLSDLLDSSVPLGHVAQAIRVGASQVSSTVLYDAYSLIRSVPDYDLLRPRFRFMNGVDMLISNLLLFPVDAIVFGSEKFANGGRTEAVRCFMGHFNDHARVSFILPQRIQGGIEIAMNLYEEEMERLLQDKEFGRFCLPL
ncbi:transferase family-domain-containing protein [Biscogniauxia marginata]|nr:transferase family-domain-containing protein [Biscogniauxia marginata]